MKKTTYRIEWEDEILHAMEETDEHGRVLYSSSKHSGILEEKRNEFDQLGRLIRERNFEDGEHKDTFEYIYYPDDKGYEKHWIIDGELYEKTILKTFPNGEETTIFQDGEEFKRWYKEGDEKQHTEKYYEYGSLVSIVKSTINERERSRTDQAFDIFEEILLKRISWFDKYDQLIKVQEFDHENRKMGEEEYEYENRTLLKSRFKDFFNGSHYQEVYEYDYRGNLISRETQTLSGQLIAFKK